MVEDDNDESSLNIIQTSLEKMNNLELKIPTCSTKLEMSKLDETPFNEKLLSNFIFEPHPDDNVLQSHLEIIYKDLIYATKGLKPSDTDFKIKQVALYDKKGLFLISSS